MYSLDINKEKFNKQMWELKFITRSKTWEELTEKIGIANSTKNVIYMRGSIGMIVYEKIAKLMEKHGIQPEFLNPK